MGLLATVMGLEPGKEGMKELTKRMKEGKIGMDELFKFLDMAAGRAKSTGAYGLAINSKQAAETRMSNAYQGFALALGTQLDESIKSSFSGLTGLLESMTQWFDDQNKKQKETGEIGAFKSTMDWLIMGIKDFGSMIVLAGQGILDLISKIPGLGGVKSMYKTYMANRQLEDAYFAQQGAKTPQAQWQLRTSGMPGFEQVKRDQFFAVDPFNTEAEYQTFAKNLSGAQSFTGNTALDIPITLRKAVLDAVSGISDSVTQSLSDAMSRAVNSGNPPIFNIYGATDPVTTGKVVEDRLNQMFFYPR